MKTPINRRQVVAALVAGFRPLGIKPQQIRPGANVRTRRGWRQVGRDIAPGARGVTVPVIIQHDRETRENAGETETRIYIRTAKRTVYHVSHTRPIGRPEEPTGQEQPNATPPAPTAGAPLRIAPF